MPPRFQEALTYFGSLIVENLMMMRRIPPMMFNPYRAYMRCPDLRTTGRYEDSFSSEGNTSVAFVVTARLAPHAFDAFLHYDRHHDESRDRIGPPPAKKRIK